MKAEGHFVYSHTDVNGEAQYFWVSPDGRHHNYSEQDLKDAGIVVNALKTVRDARDNADYADDMLDWTRPEERLAASGIDRKPLPSEANKQRPKSRKPPVDRYGWPVKADSEPKPKKDAAKEVTQKIPQPGTGFLLPSVVVGGYSPHQQEPEVWDVAVFKTAQLGANFVNLKLPPIEPLQDHLKRLQKELLRMDPEEEVEESLQCSLTQFGPARTLISDQATNGISYHIGCRAICNRAGFDALKQALFIDNEGVQNPAPHESKAADLIGFTWSGPMQGPGNLNDVILSLPPHVIEEDGAPSAGARALVLRHGSSNPNLIPKEAGGGRYGGLAPDEITYPVLNTYGPADTSTSVFVPVQCVLDLDFFSIGSDRWSVSIVRHV